MKIIVRLLLVLTFIGCAGKAFSETPAEKKRSAPASSASTVVEPAPARSTLTSVTGTVLETIDAAGYTYLRLKTPKGEIWAAVTKAAVRKGSEVTVGNATWMDGFESKTLNRKFDHIVFGTLSTGTVETSDLFPIASGHPTSMGSQPRATMAEQHAAVANAPVETGKIKVKKAEGTDGKTVAEIFAGKVSLKDSSVAVRGKVIRYNPGIMGKNWIHLRDGSGSREKKDDDITVTTLDPAAVGDVVLVKGTVRLDRDFGAGYAYPVIIEDARISK
jgi:hypothetical protein